MPPRTKKRSPDAESDLVIDNNHSSKRTKTKAPKESKDLPVVEPYVSEGKTDSNGDRYWEISKARRVTISSFRGKTMVSIREYYEKDGQELPGKKGIALPLDQFSSLVSLLPDIESALQESGESIPRPSYASGSRMIVDNEGEDCDSGDLLDAGNSRKNIEATSEDDSDE
ncbi:PC4-domain-containing protein [Aspergillus sclerotioniger CBS 115572]|uniref:PC4-domain-containing protein n=1 Tax=Aspergillus sclerotioniger CBS 115572 TaxID=1450535 RepID=A0A317X578_9EURO|nr:PC4-domain-containing protein [Aspergillus sclerotioniger CBS 115572]PWY93361.1 PC4-domain-containing protein [Aspergillus sclerotioniger CBS 115572]